MAGNVNTVYLSPEWGYHWPGLGDSRHIACGVQVLLRGQGVPPDTVHIRDRCKEPECAAQWDRHDRDGPMTMVGPEACKQLLVISAMVVRAWDLEDKGENVEARSLRNLADELVKS